MPLTPAPVKIGIEGKGEGDYPAAIREWAAPHSRRFEPSLGWRDVCRINY